MGAQGMTVTLLVEGPCRPHTALETALGPGQFQAEPLPTVLPLVFSAS